MSRCNGFVVMRSSLELARFLARPALDDDFGFGEKFDGVAALAVEDSEETLFPSAEWEIGHGGGGTARGEKRGLVAVRAAAQKIHGFVNRIGVNETEYRAEDFRIGKLAGGRQAIKNGRCKEIAGFVAGNFRVAAVENGFCAFADAGGDKRLDALL